MRFKNWFPNELAEWAKRLPGSPLIDPHNKIKIFGEIHMDNYEPKHQPEAEEDYYGDW